LVSKQAEDKATAANVSVAAHELVEAVDVVSDVTEENTAATEEMAASSTELSQAIQNIASVSEENSASVEEVSVSTEEWSEQVEQVSTAAALLTKMAQDLQQVVAQFKLEAEQSQQSKISKQLFLHPHIQATAPGNNSQAQPLEVVNIIQKR
jgi:methyl-accepting chemotaxis protein